ncbi:Uncharacterised protein [Streptococcus agalactiae]|nr:Uncharacterised protein [Streptococcus agalactiae]
MWLKVWVIPSDVYQDTFMNTQTMIPFGFLRIPILFKWFSRDIQGDVIDFVQLVAGVSFKEAVSYLETGDFELTKVIEEVYQTVSILFA